MLQRKASIITLAMSLFVGLSTAQEKKLSASEYIDTYKDIAISEMNRSGIPASITLAQGLHESGIGNSVLATEANNHFGIKCGSKWTGKEYYRWDDDPQKSCFRVYKDAMSSYIDHTEFLVNGKRYAFLFSYEKTDYKSWAEGLKKAGYATDPKYPTKLISTIEKYNLAQYDLDMGLIAANDTKSPNFENITITSNYKKRSFLFEEYAAGLFRKNQSTYAIAKDNESALAAANRFDIPYDRFLRFNDLQDGDLLIKNQFIYIQNKKSTYLGSEDFHVVEKDQSVYEIAQYYGVKVHTLYKLNHLKQGEEPENGEYIYLKERAIKKPSIRPFTHKDQEPMLAQHVVKNNEAVKQNNRPQRESKPVDQHKIIYGSTQYAQSTNSTQLDDRYAEYMTIRYDKQDEEENFDVLTTANDTKVIYSRYDEPKNESIKESSNESSKASSVQTTPTSSTESSESTNPSTSPYKTSTEEVHIASTSIQMPFNSTVNTKPVSTSKTSSKAERYHIIQAGETLYGIHRKYQVSIDALKKVNLLEDNMIIPGEKLIIPN